MPTNTGLKVTTRLIDVLEDEVDEKYYLSEEKTKKLTLNKDLSGRLNHYDYRDVDSIHSTEKVSPTLNTMQGGDRQPKIAIKQIGNIVDNKETFGGNPQRGRVYNAKGLSPALNCMRGGGLEPKIAIPTLTPDRVNKRQNGRRFKENGDPMFTLTSQDRHGVIINPLKDKTEYGWHFEQAVYDSQGITRTVKANGGSGNIPKTIEGLRIRKLTPLECWRLQGFTDEQFYKAKDSSVSNSQLYKQAGNSVTVNVVDAIVKCL